MADGSDHCPFVARCELVAELRTESALRFCQDQYCHADFRSCARHRFIASHGSPPPAALLPNGRLRGADG